MPKLEAFYVNKYGEQEQRLRLNDRCKSRVAMQGLNSGH